MDGTCENDKNTKKAAVIYNSGEMGKGQLGWVLELLLCVWRRPRDQLDHCQDGSLVHGRFEHHFREAPAQLYRRRH